MSVDQLGMLNDKYDPDRITANQAGAGWEMDLVLMFVSGMVSGGVLVWLLIVGIWA